MQLFISLEMVAVSHIRPSKKRQAGLSQQTDAKSSSFFREDESISTILLAFLLAAIIELANIFICELHFAFELYEA